MSSGIPGDELFATGGAVLGVAKLNVTAASVFTAGAAESDERLRGIPIREVSVNGYSVDNTSFNSPVENKADSGVLRTLSLLTDSLLFLAVGSVRRDFEKRIS